MILNNLKSKIESKRTMKHLCKDLAKAYPLRLREGA